MTVALLACVASAATFDADTIAFYPFTDQASGSQAKAGDTVQNAVDDARYQGTVSIHYYDSRYQGRLTFTNDVPGAYIYSDWYATNLLPSVQSVHIQSNGLTGTSPDYRPQYSGASISMAGLSDAIHENGDYTLECFCKLSAREDYGQLIFSWADADKMYLKTAYSSASTTVRLAEQDCNGPYFPGTTARYNANVTYPSSLLDGKWHHVAVVRDSAAQKYTLYCDYGFGSTTLTNWPGTAPQERAFVVGNDAYRATSGWRSTGIGDGLISAVRVTKRKLTPAEFMVALPQPFRADSRAYRWACEEGPLGSAVSSLSNALDAVDFSADRLTQYVFANATEPTGFGFAGYSGTGSRSNPVTDTLSYAGNVPKLKPYLLLPPELVRNTSAVRLRSTAVPSGTYMSVGPSAYWSAQYRQQPALKAFTFEGFFKLDYDSWSNNVVKVMRDHSATRYRTTLMGLADTGGSNHGVCHLKLVSGDGDNFNLTLSCCLPTVGDKDYYYTRSGKAFAFSMREWAQTWHHVAFSYDVESPQALTIWMDYVPCTVPLDETLGLNAAKNWVYGSGFNNCAFDGYVDEMRLTYRVLGAGDFPRMKSGSGLCISIR